jgi:outer membrane protein OmpA-like peptidoglycan-associated protein
MIQCKVSAVAIAVIIAGCTTTNLQYGEKSASNTTKDAAVGTLAGGIGNAMDRQQKTLNEKMQGNGVEVIRAGNTLKVVLPGDISFASGSAQINTEFRPALDSLAESLNANPQTRIQVVGHSDSAGKWARNLKLSQDRALSVTAYLTAKGVSAGRLYASSLGPDKPIADNKTDAGRAKNRRVELEIVPMNGVAGWEIPQ